jgi:hypothetical protein
MQAVSPRMQNFLTYNFLKLQPPFPFNYMNNEVGIIIIKIATTVAYADRNMINLGKRKYFC